MEYKRRTQEVKDYSKQASEGRKDIKAIQHKMAELMDRAGITQHQTTHGKIVIEAVCKIDSA